MFRLSNLLKSTLKDTPPRVLNGSIAIWNFTNRCNLSCLHCYSKASLDSIDTLSTQKVMETLPKLKEGGVKFIIFSGGEPLIRRDIFDIAKEARELGIITYLSTNGLYIKSSNVEEILDTFDYIGVSVDGREDIHDKFRGLKGAFRETIKSLELLNSFNSKKVGIRFTLTKETYSSLEFIFKLAEELNIPKIYISHLVYSGRGFDNLNMDISKHQRLEAVNYIIDKAFEYYDTKRDIEIVTGNMEMDAILFLNRFAKRYPNLKSKLISRLLSWGGNSAGRKLLNIDAEGNVKPDPFFPFSVGNILKDDFLDIWRDRPNKLLESLRRSPRKLKGRCDSCKYLDICNGGSRSRAYAIYGDIWEFDPSCYIEEIENEKYSSAI